MNLKKFLFFYFLIFNRIFKIGHSKNVQFQKMKMKIIKKLQKFGLD